MRRNTFLILGISAALCLNGCRSAQADTETEALQQQIEQLEQQIRDLEEQITSGSAEELQNIPDNSTSQAEGGTDQSLPAASPETEAAPEDGTRDLSTTHTLEELTDMVAAYEEKADNAAPSGTASEDMEQFLSLKQEEKTIDDLLDRHEDELEYLYRNNTLSRDEYKALDRELERLEDRLDAAEDLLEYTFGIDD